MSEDNGTKPEVTLEDLADKLEVVSNLLGIMMLALGGYPLQADLVTDMVNRAGVQFDPKMLGQNQRRVVLPGQSIIPTGRKGM